MIHGIEPAVSHFVRTALQTQFDLHLIIGHGAGSFGHVPASEYKITAIKTQKNMLLKRLGGFRGI